MQRRRAILEGVGLTATAGFTGIASASESQNKIVKLKRDFGDGLSPGQVIAAQRKEFTPFVKNRFSLGSVKNIPDDQEIVGIVAGINKSGETKRYVGTADSSDNAKKVHAELEQQASVFREEL